MKTLERRIERLEHAAADPDSEVLSFDIRFVDPGTKTETGRLVLNSDGRRTEYEADGHDKWRKLDEPA